MSTPRWRVWLHRIGYVTTTIVGAEVCALGFFAAKHEFDDWRRQRKFVAESAYGEGPFWQTEWLLPHLAVLPPLATLKPDGFRFAANPSLDRISYAVAFKLIPSRTSAEGVLIIDLEPYQKPATRTRYRCALAARDYRALTKVWDAALDGFAGSRDGAGTDGTSIAFERVRGQRVTSGGGNFVEPYRRVGDVVLRYVREGCPGAPLPPGGDDWYLPSAP